MADKTFIWKGPPTAVDVWSEPHGPGVTLIFSGQVSPGREIPVPLPEENSLVVGWLAFELIEEKPASRKPAGKHTATEEKTDG